MRDEGETLESSKKTTRVSPCLHMLGKQKQTVRTHACSAEQDRNPKIRTGSGRPPESSHFFWKMQSDVWGKYDAATQKIAHVTAGDFSVNYCRFPTYNSGNVNRKSGRT